MPGLGVLITRPAGDAAATAAAVQARGLMPIIAPMLVVRPLVLRAPAHPVQAILLSSRNAVPALAGMAAWRGRPVLTVGDATADAARAAGFDDVRSARGDARALQELACRSLAPAGGTLLLATAAGEGMGLAAGLRLAGFSVQRRLAYRVQNQTRFPAAAAASLREGRVGAAAFFSARTAATFVRLLPHDLRVKLHGVRALAIGNQAADALKPLGWAEVAIAPHPTLDGILSLL